MAQPRADLRKHIEKLESDLAAMTEAHRNMCRSEGKAWQSEDRWRKRAIRGEEALQFVRDWLDGKPTPQGWIIGHGTKEIRAAVAAALTN